MDPPDSFQEGTDPSASYECLGCHTVVSRRSAEYVCSCTGAHAVCKRCASRLSWEEVSRAFGPDHPVCQVFAFSSPAWNDLMGYICTKKFGTSVELVLSHQDYWRPILLGQPFLWLPNPRPTQLVSIRRLASGPDLWLDMGGFKVPIAAEVDQTDDLDHLPLSWLVHTNVWFGLDLPRRVYPKAEIRETLEAILAHSDPVRSMTLADACEFLAESSCVCSPGPQPDPDLPFFTEELQEFPEPVPVLADHTEWEKLAKTSAGGQRGVRARTALFSSRRVRVPSPPGDFSDVAYFRQELGITQTNLDLRRKINARPRRTWAQAREVWDSFVAEKRRARLEGLVDGMSEYVDIPCLDFLGVPLAQVQVSRMWPQAPPDQIEFCRTWRGAYQIADGTIRVKSVDV